MNPQYPFVSARAKHACEYCHAPEIVFNLPFEIEHITPHAEGGSESEDNLALSCRSCNLYKSNFVRSIDELTQQKVVLFNPRHDVWTQHFSLADESGEIRGLTPVGRATVARLRMNAETQLQARREWLRLGLMS